MAKIVPWSIAELNQLMGAAQTMPGEVAGIPARLWWPAVLLTLLDTGIRVEELLAIPAEAFDKRRGTLAAGSFRFALDPHTIDAILAILEPSRASLFSWELDGGKRPFHMLHREYRKLLFRAKQPHVAANSFDRLRITASLPNVLQRVNLALPFEPQEGEPRFPRARDRRRWNEPPRPPARRDSRAKRRIITIAIPGDRTLQAFFDHVYSPLRLPVGSKKQLEAMRDSIRRLADFAGCEVTLDALSDDFMQRFLSWLVRSGRSPATANKHRGAILALWRFARRKRLVLEEPLDVPKIKEAKRLPEAWSLEDMQRIIAAAEHAPGQLCGIPARTWWPAFIRVLFYTGLRVNAALQLKTNDLQPETGWLFVLAAYQKQQADQVFRLNAETLAAIAATKPEERGLLFPSPYTEAPKLGKLYREILKQAGLPHGARDLFHKLRRTSATHIAAAAGEDEAVRHLGHSSATVTKRYLDPTKLNRSQSTDVLPSLKRHPA